jgi:hypothetical protein
MSGSTTHPCTTYKVTARRTKLVACSGREATSNGTHDYCGRTDSGHLLGKSPAVSGCCLAFVARRTLSDT